MRFRIKSLLGWMASLLEVFKEDRDVLLSELLSVFHDPLEGGNLPASMRYANIVVILKPGKDPPGLRPTSLLTVDVKILTIVLVQRLIRVITCLIYEDRSDFILAKSTVVNLRRLFLNLQLTPERAILSLDAVEAFNSVEWSFLRSVMVKMGFGPLFFVMGVPIIYLPISTCIG